MTDRERIERLENALTTLAEQTARNDRRWAELSERMAEQSAKHEMKMEELATVASRSERREQVLLELAADFRRLLGNHERRISDHTRLLEVLTEKLLRHDESIDELKAGQSDFDHKLAALTDAHLQTEEAMAEAGRKIDALAASQAHSDRKLDALIDVVRDLLEGRRPGGGALT